MRDDPRAPGHGPGGAPEEEGGLETPHPDEGPGSGALRCELCGGRVLDRHCKIVCLNCGYQRDCSDP